MSQIKQNPAHLLLEAKLDFITLLAIGNWVIVEPVAESLDVVYYICSSMHFFDRHLCRGAQKLSDLHNDCQLIDGIDLIICLLTLEESVHQYVYLQYSSFRNLVIIERVENDTFRQVWHYSLQNFTQTVCFYLHFPAGNIIRVLFLEQRTEVIIIVRSVALLLLLLHGLHLLLI